MYDPNIAPTTLEEYEQLIDYKLKESQTAHVEAKVKAATDAESAWNAALPAKRAALIAELKKHIDSLVMENGESLPDDQINDLLRRGIHDIDAALEAEKAQAIENAVSMIEQPESREAIQAMYAFLKPRPIMKEPEYSLPDLSQAFYKLDNGCVYSVQSREFVEAQPSTGVIDVPGGTEADLRKLLVFYDLPIGDCLLTPEEIIARKRAAIDADTSGKILDGFDYEINDEMLHFSYDSFDQQNFADTANACLMAKTGAEGLPDTVNWNAYRHGTGELVRLTLTADEFLALYAKGALNHKAVCMEAGGLKKAEISA